MADELKIFGRYLRNQGLKFTQPRKKILSSFLKTQRHISGDELYVLVSRIDPGIGYATVYRNLKLFVKSGLAREVDLGDRITRFEHNYGHKHHDHLICIECRRSIEIFNPQIEKLQEELARKARFKALRHNMDIFGLCLKCQTSNKYATFR